MSNAIRLDSNLIPNAQREFEAAMPRINAVIRYQFRHYRWSKHRLAEAYAEATAATWVAWHGLLRRGKDPQQVGVSAIVGFACRGVKNGRTVGANRALGRGAGDLYHPRIRRATGLRVLAFDDLPGDSARSWHDWLRANERRFGPADEAAIRLDFAAWLDSLPQRKRRAAELLAQGLNTGEVAAKLQVTPAAVSQDRLWLARSWHQFQAQLETID
jgi:hypothetical protein